MIPLYRRYVAFIISRDRNTFLPKEAYDWLKENRRDPSKSLWPQAVYTQIISPAEREGLIVRSERGFYRLTNEAFEMSYDEPEKSYTPQGNTPEELKEDKEWWEYIQKKIKGSK